MNTKQKLILLTATHISIFLFATLFYSFTDTGRSMVHSAEKLTAPTVVTATATFSERITEDEKAINEIKKEPQMIEALDMLALSVHQAREKERNEAEARKYTELANSFEKKMGQTNTRASSLITSLQGDTNAQEHVKAMRNNGTLSK